MTISPSSPSSKASPTPSPSSWTPPAGEGHWNIRPNGSASSAPNRPNTNACRRELEDAGISVTPALPPAGQLLTVLRHDGEDLTAESHAGCPGRGAFFRSYDPATPVHYCADPAAYGHTFRHADLETSGNAVDATDTPDPAGEGDGGPPDAARRLVIQGNKAWKAAAQVRKRWLATNLFPRRTVPREAAQFVTRQLLTMPDPLRSGLATAHSRALFTEITGQPADKWEEACDTAAAPGSRC